MDDATTMYVIFALFAMTMGGIAGVWTRIDSIRDRIEHISTQIEILDMKLKYHIAGGDIDG